MMLGTIKKQKKKSTLETFLRCKKKETFLHFTFVQNSFYVSNQTLLF